MDTIVLIVLILFLVSSLVYLVFSIENDVKKIELEVGKKHRKLSSVEND